MIIDKFNKGKYDIFTQDGKKKKRFFCKFSKRRTAIEQGIVQNNKIDGKIPENRNQKESYGSLRTSNQIKTSKTEYDPRETARIRTTRRPKLGLRLASGCGGVSSRQKTENRVGDWYHIII